MTLLSHNEVHLPLPEGWSDGSHVIALGPPREDYRQSFVLLSEELRAKEGLKAYVERHTALLRQLEGYAIQAEGHSKVGPHEGFLREHSFVMNQVRLSQLQFITVYGHKAFTFTFSDLAQRFAQSRAAALEMIARAQFRSQADTFDKKPKLVDLATEPQRSEEAAPSGPTMQVPRGNVKG